MEAASLSLPPRLHGSEDESAGCERILSVVEAVLAKSPGLCVMHVLCGQAVDSAGLAEKRLVSGACARSRHLQHDLGMHASLALRSCSYRLTEALSAQQSIHRSSRVSAVS